MALVSKRMGESIFLCVRSQMHFSFAFSTCRALRARCSALGHSLYRLYGEYHMVSLGNSLLDLETVIYDVPALDRPA